MESESPLWTEGEERAGLETELHCALGRNTGETTAALE